MPSVLHPAEHDEPALHLPVFARTFAHADALVFLTMAERQLVQCHFPVASRPQILLGLGTEAPLPRKHLGCEVLGLGDRPYVVSVGRVDGHKGSKVLEAFSLVVTEAWSLELPAVVNARCGATREHCERSGGGLWFGSYLEFEAVLDRLAADRELRRHLGKRGRSYVERHYRWPVLIERYARFLDDVVVRAKLPPSSETG